MVNFIRGATRIYRPYETLEPTLRTEGATQGKPAPQTQGDNYLSALLKLIPSEMIAVYNGIKETAATHHFSGGWFLLCLATCIILRAYSNLPKKQDVGIWDVQWLSVCISAVAFYLWVFAGGLVTEYDWINMEQWLASASAGLFGILAPLVVPGAPSDESRS